MSGAIALYHIRHQYGTIRQLLDLYSMVDLFNLRPLYAFSRVSAVTAIGLMVASTSWYITAPDLLNQPATIPYYLLYLFMAVSAFVWPVIRVHRLLLDEKERMLAEISARLQALKHELFRRIDGGDITDMENLNKAMASVELEYDMLRRVPTWPWQADTLNAVIIAVLFPVVVWFLQTILERMLIR